MYRRGLAGSNTAGDSNFGSADDCASKFTGRILTSTGGGSKCKKTLEISSDGGSFESPPARGGAGFGSGHSSILDYFLSSPRGDACDCHHLNSRMSSFLTPVSHSLQCTRLHILHIAKTVNVVDLTVHIFRSSPLYNVSVVVYLGTADFAMCPHLTD